MIKHAQPGDNNRIIIRKLCPFNAAPSTTERAASSSLYGAKYRFKKLHTLWREEMNCGMANEFFSHLDTYC